MWHWVGGKYKQEKRILEMSSPNEDRDLPLISSVIPAGRRVKRGNKEKELWKQSRGRNKGGLVLKGGGIQDYVIVKVIPLKKDTGGISRNTKREFYISIPHQMKCS